MLRKCSIDIPVELVITKLIKSSLPIQIKSNFFIGAGKNSLGFMLSDLEDSISIIKESGLE